jgi:NAD+ synthase
MRKAKAAGLVLGVSGGIDSSTTAALCSIAIDPDKITTLYMPEKETYNKTDHNHVKELAEKFQFHLKTIDLTDALSTLYKTIPTYNSKDQISKGNLKARTRMIIWYYYANHQDRIVVGSSDKSETMIGYYTKWGDGGADITPLMDLYKTQVRQLAQHLAIPTAIIQKPSSPNLWPDQKAEEEIGLKYETLDLILYGLERFMPIQTIAKQLNLPTKTIATIKNKWLQTEHKRRMPLTPKLEYRTINADFRFPLHTQGNAR